MRRAPKPTRQKAVAKRTKRLALGVSGGSRCTHGRSGCTWRRRAVPAVAVEVVVMIATQWRRVRGPTPSEGDGDRHLSSTEGANKLYTLCRYVHRRSGAELAVPVCRHLDPRTALLLAVPHARLAHSYRRSRGFSAYRHDVRNSAIRDDDVGVAVGKLAETRGGGPCRRIATGRRRAHLDRRRRRKLPRPCCRCEHGPDSPSEVFPSRGPARPFRIAGDVDAVGVPDRRRACTRRASDAEAFEAVAYAG